jgi:hypothetical protein
VDVSAYGSLDAIPPALRFRLRGVLAWVPDADRAFSAPGLTQWKQVLKDGEPWLGAEASLAQIGYDLLAPARDAEVRRQACIWLTMFPGVETAKRLAETALDATTPPPVREQAIWSLAYRQARDMHPSVVWPDDAVRIADEALCKLAELSAAGKLASDQLAHALRSVGSDSLGAIVARAPGLWGDALECFASAPLARVLLVSLDDLPAQHRRRVLRLVAATLGEEVVPLLATRAIAQPIDMQLEMLLLAIALGGDRHVGRFEDAIADLQATDFLRARAKWHLAHKGVVPSVLGLRTARTSALVPPADRAAACGRAADDLAVLASFERYPEAIVYTLWGWMVRGSGDPARARELVRVHPDAQTHVRDLYLEDLARRGRVKQLAIAAQALGGADLGALALAVWGRPLAALELAATAREHTAALVCARALGCFRAGRPDLTARLLAEDLPPSEITDDRALAPFPGPDEQWLSERAGDPRAAGPSVTAVRALAAGLDGVIALARRSPLDAEPDVATLDPIASVVRRLGKGLAGSTVFLAGEFQRTDRAKVLALLEAAGARTVAGPFPGTDYYVHGDHAPVQLIAQLERQGARRLRDVEEKAS